MTHCLSEYFGAIKLPAIRNLSNTLNYHQSTNINDSTDKKTC